MGTTARNTITDETITTSALQELVLLGLKAKYTNDTITEVLDIKPGARGTYELTVRREPQETTFLRAVLDVEADHVAMALNQLTEAGRFWQGFSKAEMARQHKYAAAGMPTSLLQPAVAEKLAQLDLQQLKECAEACAAGTPWTGA